MCVCVLFGSLTTTSCVKEDDYLSNLVDIKFSTDTLKFDTVFTTLGSTTKQVRVYNTSDYPVKFDKVTLKNGADSRFRINADGDTSMIIRDLEIAANDSIFIFIRVNINPNNDNNPFVIDDGIVFEIGSKSKTLSLQAYGRNAIYHIPTHSFTSGGTVYNYSVIDCSKPWDAGKPHIVFGYAVVDEDSILTINQGAEIYFATDASLWVYDGGTLNIDGNSTNPVLLTSLRKDGHYNNLPGQWQGLWLSAGSKDNLINGAVIENATIGLLIDTVVNNNPTLKITNSIVQNMSLAGIYGQGAAIEGDNLLVANCETATVALTLGGKYKFTNSTFVNYWSYTARRSPSVILNNWYEDVYGNIQLRPLLLAEFDNCIIYGSMEEELLFDITDMTDFNPVFNNCLIRTKRDASAIFSESIQNENPQFIDFEKANYHIKDDSPARNAGNYTYISIPYDLDNVPRANPPSIGAYEYVKIEEENK